MDVPLKNSVPALFIEELVTWGLDFGAGLKASASEMSAGLQFHLLNPNLRYKVTC